MEKISINLDLPASLKKYEEEQLEELRNNEFVQQYLIDNNMNDEDLRKNLPLFVMMIRELQECEACGGLATCKKSERGYIPVLKKKRFVDFAKKPCKYMVHELEMRKKEAYYLYQPFTRQQMSITLDTMKVFHEDPSYMNAFAQILDYVLEPQGKGIYLYGSVGVGKTYLMMALCNEFASQGKTVAFVNVTEFLLEHKTKIDYELLERVKNADFMVLDDIGQESVTAYHRDEILFPLLNDRMMMGKATCFTSNFDFAGLQEHFCVNIYNDREELKALRVMERIKALSKEVNLIGKSRR
ncbi:MAG: hypothetical protein E7191_07190 [Erysipelotrichaceae bacterium]|nr:hypothetical protein [Erysipelotrichaceae bacterium]MBQ9987025.1 ATP-binding protein [Erysipelotrichales bacterium]